MITNKRLETLKRFSVYEVSEIASELLAARATLAKLPLTADNVPVVPGMVVYYTHDGFGPNPMVVDKFCEWATRETVDPFVRSKINGHYDVRYASECYSTREAAQAAKEGGNGNA